LFSFLNILKINDLKKVIIFWRKNVLMYAFFRKNQRLFITHWKHWYC